MAHDPAKPLDVAVVQEASEVAPGLVRCLLNQDTDRWEQLWLTSPSPILTAAALSGLAAHLLRRVSELTDGDTDQILQDFALGLARQRPEDFRPSDP